MLSQEEKNRIAERLNQRFAEHGVKCPMCGNNSFSLADGYFSNVIQDNLNGLVIGGPSIPAIPIICNKCGFISMHALGTLGLLPPRKEEKKGGE
jgi:hypothetical protein